MSGYLPAVSTGYKEIYFGQFGGQVKTKVCDPGCQETVLLEYQGPSQAAQALTTAQVLRTVVANKDLFQGALEVEKHSQLIVDNSLIPWNTSTLVDLSESSLTPRQRLFTIVGFINNLWTSGVLPTQTSQAQKQIKEFRQQLGYRFRDPKLMGLNELAGLYLQTHQFCQAEKTARRIINFQYTVTQSRPLFYDEAVFLIADIGRIRAMITSKAQPLLETLAILRTGQEKLMDLEHGYKTRYNYELLRTCAQFYQIAAEPHFEQTCSPPKVKSYFYNATYGFNRYLPAFKDNFLAIKSMLSYAAYKTASRKSGLIHEAIADYHKVFTFIRFIKDPTSVLQGNINQNWAFYSPLMHKNDRWLGRTVGIETGLRSYIFRNKITRLLRNSQQFEPKFFLLFEAQAYQSLAASYRQLALVTKNYNYLHWSINYLKQALRIIRQIKALRIATFYQPALFSERNTYNKIASDYITTLYSYYYATNKTSVAATRDLLNKTKHPALELYQHSKACPLDPSLAKAWQIYKIRYELRKYIINNR